MDAFKHIVITGDWRVFKHIVITGDTRVTTWVLAFLLRSAWARGVDPQHSFVTLQ